MLLIWIAACGSRSPLDAGKGSGESGIAGRGAGGTGAVSGAVSTASGGGPSDGVSGCLGESGCGCLFGDFVFALGASRPVGDGCNSCTCTSVGWQCTSGKCDCTLDGGHFDPGTTISIGCSQCVCETRPGGAVRWGCTDVCVPACRYGDVGYTAADAFPSRDGCNFCTCGAGGAVSCSDAPCTCHPDQEWWRRYIHPYPGCSIDFECPPETQPFANACGCGCEEGNGCTEPIVCRPQEGPQACSAILQACPYSTHSP